MSFSERLFATLSIDKLRARSASSSVLRRALGARDLAAIGLGSMIGGGIFTTIGTGVKGAGPAVIVSYLLAGLTSFFAALCYAELGAMVPVAGSAYTYAYATLGKLWAWIIGFALVFEYGISAAPVAQQFSAALQDVLHAVGITLPAWAQTSNVVINGPWWSPASWNLATSQVDVIGAIFVLALCALLSLGIRETAATNNVFVVLKIGALIVFIIAGATLFHAANFHDFAPYGFGHLAPFGGVADYSSTAQPFGIVPVAAYVFFNYIGFDAATTTAEECRNPQRDVPLGVLGALGIGTLLYCTTTIVLIGTTPWMQVTIKDPLVHALAPLHLPFVSAIITLGVLAGTTSVALSSLLGQSRIFYVMARDRMLPPAIASVHPKFRTPIVTTMLTGIVVAVLTLALPLNQLLNLVNIGTLLAFSVVCAGVLYLRKRKPDMPRSFRVPFVPLFPILGVVLSLSLAVFGLSSVTWAWFTAALVAGLVIFFSYGFWKSDPALIALDETVDAVPLI